MKKTKIYFFFLTTILFSCQNKEETVAYQEKTLGEQIQNDPIAQQLSDINQQRVSDNLNGKYNISHLDMKLIEENKGKCKTNDDFVTLYEKAGLKNAKEYFAINFRQVALLQQLYQKYPTLKSLQREKQIEIIGSAYQKGTQERLNQHKEKVGLQVKQ